MVEYITSGGWAEGERIPPERELCQTLGVGRSSLREATKALELIGLIETRLGDGTYVCRRTDYLSRPLLWTIVGSGASESSELIEARKLIEVELAGSAALRATPDDLKRIGIHLDDMEASLDDVAKFQAADIAFHVAVGEAGHNRILLNCLHLIRNLMFHWIRVALGKPEVAAEALEQHRAIFFAIAKRNPAEARNAMKRHLELMAVHLQSKESPAPVSVPTS
jgi:GntR family transcriptional repressor for pyruvate dehydrogenase complex